MPSHLTDGHPPYRCCRPAASGQRASMQTQVQICQATSRAPLQVYSSGLAIGLCLFIPASPPRTCLLLAWGPCAQYRSVSSVSGRPAARLISEKQSGANQFACEIGRVGYSPRMVDCSATALRQIARAGAARSPPMCASRSYTGRQLSGPRNPQEDILPRLQGKPRLTIAP